MPFDQIRGYVPLSWDRELYGDDLGYFVSRVMDRTIPPLVVRKVIGFRIIDENDSSVEEMIFSRRVNRIEDALLMDWLRWPNNSNFDRWINQIPTRMTGKFKRNLICFLAGEVNHRHLAEKIVFGLLISVLDWLPRGSIIQRTLRRMLGSTCFNLSRRIRDGEDLLSFRNLSQISRPQSLSLQIAISSAPYIHIS